MGQNGVTGLSAATKEAGRIVTEHSARPGKEVSAGRREVEDGY